VGDGPATVVEAAIAEAALHGCSVRVLHAWRVTAAYDVLLPEDAVWSHQTGMAIGAAIGSVAAAHPDVTVEPDVEHSYPADALVEASQVSDLLVIGRHGHHRTSPPRLGSLARLVVRESACPVMVVPLG
jgi:nucleotide-binding universal stress UspA family protein